MSARAASGTDTTCPPRFSMAQPSAPDRCAECRQPTSRRWSSGRFASVSTHRRRLTTGASSRLTSHESRLSRSRWLDELITAETATTESIAKRERCSVRKVNMTISLAFLAPDLVKAAIDGRLPHGMGVARLADLPAEWSRQHQMLGLAAQ